MSAVDVILCQGTRLRGNFNYGLALGFFRFIVIG
jgi:hypothetical protein